jgi:DNA-directed RNA polymerase subunit RPC12/RpoP
VLAIYICLDCGRVFNKPREAHEAHDELPERPYETFAECPGCGGEDIERAETCAECDAYIGESQARYNLCPMCESSAEARFKQILSEQFTKNELEYLNNQYDGLRFGL